MAKLVKGKNGEDEFNFDSEVLLQFFESIKRLSASETDAVNFECALGAYLRLRGVEIESKAVDYSNQQSIMTALAGCSTCGKVIQFFSGVRATDESAGQLRREIMKQDMEAAKSAWEIQYIVSQKVLDFVAGQLQGYVDQWDPHHWYVPLTALVQSSGWGKSRLMCQMWRKDFYVVYISCMKESQTGFPRRTGVLADILQHSESTESSFVALAVSILAVLNQHADMTCEAWMKEQEKDNTILHEIHAKFQTMKNSIGDVKDMAFSEAEMYFATFWKVEIDKLKQRDVKVLLCVDEAGELGDNFAKFRRSLRSIPRRANFLSIVLGTDRTVADLAAAAEDDPSARVRLATPLHIFHPIYLVGKSDIFSQAGAGSSGAETSSSSDITNPCNVIRYGRPLWAAYYDSVRVNDKLSATIQLAKMKLLGKNTNTQEMGWVTRDISIAVFACIVGLDVVAWGTLSQELVARHMRTIVCISKDRRRAYTAAAAEPVLAAAAAQLLHANDDALLAVFLDRLTEVCLDGLVLEGIRGEIVARIVIMLAMHECTKSSDYIKPVPLATFLETMFGSKLVQDLKDNCVNMEATIFFNCFIPTSVTPSPQLLDDCFVRCAALVARRNECVLDFALPARAGLPHAGVSAPQPARPGLRRAAEKNKVDLPSLHHRISFPAQAKNQRGQVSLGDAVSAAQPARPGLPRAAKKCKVDLPPLDHRLSLPGQVKNRRGQVSLGDAVEKLQEDERLDARLELLFQIGDRGENERVYLQHTTVVVRGLEGFEHLKSERMKAAGVLERLRILSRTCEDVFKDASIKEKDILQELIPLGFNAKRFMED